MNKFHPVKDGYKSFEKWTNCMHKSRNEIAENCMGCDVEWLIARCKHLESLIVATIPKKECAPDIKEMLDVIDDIKKRTHREG